MLFCRRSIFYVSLKGSNENKFFEISRILVRTQYLNSLAYTFVTTKQSNKCTTNQTNMSSIDPLIEYSSRYKKQEGNRDRQLVISQPWRSPTSTSSSCLSSSSTLAPLHLCLPLPLLPLLTALQWFDLIIQLALYVHS